MYSKLANNSISLRSIVKVTYRTKTMERDILRDDQWERVKDLLPGKSTDCGVTADNQKFLKTVIWILRTGAPWLDLPSRYGS